MPGGGLAGVESADVRVAQAMVVGFRYLAALW
ncbi:hypothetical protein JOD54_000323 [Actinokineospora baliensis]|nr:hypothetical protein [Actinokineospora baliensis]